MKLLSGFLAAVLLCEGNNEWPWFEIPTIHEWAPELPIAHEVYGGRSWFLADWGDTGVKYTVTCNAKSSRSGDAYSEMQKNNNLQISELLDERCKLLCGKVSNRMEMERCLSSMPSDYTVDLRMEKTFFYDSICRNDIDTAYRFGANTTIPRFFTSAVFFMGTSKKVQEYGEYTVWLFRCHNKDFVPYPGDDRLLYREPLPGSFFNFNATRDPVVTSSPIKQLMEKRMKQAKVRNFDLETNAPIERKCEEIGQLPDAYSLGKMALLTYNLEDDQDHQFRWDFTNDDIRTLTSNYTMNLNEIYFFPGGGFNHQGCQYMLVRPPGVLMATLELSGLRGYSPALVTDCIRELMHQAH